ncbi:MAG TPA: AAA family ATPase [Actinoplanes sp.]|nr:AAA family ATPase [Actinoplanes sp.]
MAEDPTAENNEFAQGGRAVDGTETGWGRPAEPGPRWRALLDRALHASRIGEDSEPEAPETDAPPEFGRPAQPLPMRPTDRRTWAAELGAADLGQPAPEPRALPPRPVNPLERRATSRAEPAPTEPRPVNPLDPRRPSRTAESFSGRAEAEPPNSFFNPSIRSAPPPTINRTPQADIYRAAAPVGSAAVLPPTSPAPARIEWRQAEPEQDTDRAVAVLRRKLGKPRVLAFANPKGGVHKTTATVLAAATVGSVRGRGVLAWDDNELRGTLGLRAGSARHARTIRHLLSDLLQIENMHGDALLHELDGYLRHASDGTYDVLAGEENPRFAQRLDQYTVRRVMDLLRRTHDVICVDTGNNVESVNWQTVMAAADQLVITTVPREDAAFTADWMLDLLDDIGQDDLVRNAVTLISCPSPGRLPLLDDLTQHFATRTRAVAVVPYDPALEAGSSIEYAELLPETRAAWLKAASTMIEPFVE